VAAQRCKWALQLDRELDVWSMLSNLGNWATTNRVVLAPSAAWNGGAQSDPIADLKARIVASAQVVTDVWFNQEVAFDFLGHPLVREHMRQFLGDRGVDTAVANVNNAGTQIVDFVIPGFPPFHVCASKVLNEATGELDFILPPDVLLVTTPPGVPVDG